MTGASHVFGGRALAGLRRLKHAAPIEERCDLCSAGLDAQHKHFVECSSHLLLCVCGICTILLDGKTNQKYCRVSSNVRRLPAFGITKLQWQALGIPVGLAFFYAAGTDSGIFAVFPSPAGPVRSAVDTQAWRALERDSPVLGSMAPYVEGLLVNRGRSGEDYLLAPIDECYRLVGTIRRHWQGMSGGGAEVQEHVARCLEELRARAIGVPVEIAEL